VRAVALRLKGETLVQLHTDYSLAAVSRADRTPWVASPLKGVDRKMLERNGDEVARATTIVRYQAGSYFSPHTHTGGEEFIVLEGIFSDEHGNYPAGMYVRNPVGSKHKPFSKEGCTILVKLWQMPPDDQDFVRIDMGDDTLWKTAENGVQTLRLHTTGHEVVEAFKIPAGQTLNFRDEGGIELFIISGVLETSGAEYRTGDWLRFPAGEAVDASASEDLLLWKKAGHLIDPPALP
jgi:anti-sigma factor ChrR (cupin superfamily)